MKFQSISKGQDGRFIHRYDLTYQTETGNRKVYEIISRRDDLRNLSDIINEAPAAIVLIMTDDRGRILINREFRMAVGQWVYNFPAGLIDTGETPEEAGKRELREETGLNLTEITDIIGKSFSAIGFSEESNLCIVGRATGTFSKSTSDEEEIIPGWYTKEEVRELLKREPFAARTQAWCYVWCRA